MSSHPLADRTVLDAGAGAGAASSALSARRARVLAMDLSAGLLDLERGHQATVCHRR